jgi:hypothetical protein
MRVISFNSSASRTEPTLRVRQAARATHLRIIERVGPVSDTSTGRLIQFHSHNSPRPAA